jgi:hypothetical protein
LAARHAENRKVPDTMTIPCPPCTWPTTLAECGPEEDPAILLVGSAEIGESSTCVMAIRISGTQDRSDETHAMSTLEPALDAFLKSADGLAARLGNVLGVRAPSIIQLESGPYFLWMLPLAPARVAPSLEAPATTLKTESELRSAVIDRLIAARLSERKPAEDAMLKQLPTLSARRTDPASGTPKAG